VTISPKRVQLAPVDPAFYYASFTFCGNIAFLAVNLQVVFDETFHLVVNWAMAVTRVNTFDDYEREQAGIANRLGQAREFLGVTQTEFAAQISITRDRLASYEDGRAPLRCDIALRACRQFFISEFWLAYGSVTEQKLTAKETAIFSDLDAHLTMALAIEPIGLSFPPGVSFAQGFKPYLRQEYSKLAAEQNGFPRIKPLASDGPEYFTNALDCMIGFWKRGLSAAQWQTFFYDLVLGAQSLQRQIREPDSKLAARWTDMNPAASAVVRK
jgi:transcriptional regulator with XRE-family HTH domain